MNVLHFLAKYTIFMILLPLLMTPFIGIDSSWLLMAVLVVFAVLTNVSWLLLGRRRFQLRGKAYETRVDGKTVFMFELLGDANLLEVQNEVVFDVVRQGADFSPP